MPPLVHTETIDYSLWIRRTFTQSIADGWRTERWIRNGFLDSIVIGDFECLREEKYAKCDIDEPNGESTKAYGHHYGGGRFTRYNQVFGLSNRFGFDDRYGVCFMLNIQMENGELFISLWHD